MALVGKIVVSTPVDVDIVEKLDAVCAKARVTRSQLLRGLIHALLIEGEQSTFEAWRKEVTGA